MTLTHNEFFVNGHYCKIEGSDYKEYTTYIDGEQFQVGHEAYRGLKENLIEEAKGRDEKSPETPLVAEVIYNYLTTVDEDWVTTDVIKDAIFPELDNFPFALKNALKQLTEEGVLAEISIASKGQFDSAYQVNDS